MSELPPGGTRTTLGEIGEYLNGRGFKKSEWRESGRPIIRIQNLTGSGARFNYFDGEADERHIAREGDLLVSWAATLGVFVWRGPEAVVNQHIFKVESHVDRRFHRYLLQSALADLQRQTHGSGMVHITKSKFDSTRVALPPLNEQRRIVAAIEEQLSRLDAADASLAQASRRLVALDSATLVAVTDGHRLVELGSVTTAHRYGTSIKCLADGGGPPVLRIPNVREGRINTTDLKFATTNEVGECIVDSGDLLFIRTNGSRDLIGRVAAVDGAAGMSFASYLIRARPDPAALDSRWAVLTLSSPSLRAVIQARAASTAGQYNLNLKALRSLEIPLPPLEDQRRIVAEVEERLSVIDAMRASIERAERRSAVLRRSILERAFRGELVPQNPSDEPASVLLDRIRAAAR
ncbi:MAG: restriction endonuclease subunit S [Actinobacteria bacterium]|nr:restriction endonuclease subunit S [Actinomycetota bacterium]